MIESWRIKHVAHGSWTGVTEDGDPVFGRGMALDFMGERHAICSARRLECVDYLVAYRRDGNEWVKVWAGQQLVNWEEQERTLVLVTMHVAILEETTIVGAFSDHFWANRAINAHKLDILAKESSDSWELDYGETHYFELVDLPVNTRIPFNGITDFDVEIVA